MSSAAARLQWLWRAASAVAADDPGRVRVVICTFQSRRDVGEAIASCLHERVLPEQVTVVDNGSGDGTVEWLRQRFPEVRLLALKDNLGFSRAVNLGAGDVGGDYLLMLNPDARVQRGALAAMLAALAADPKRGAISPRVERTDGSLDRACRRSFPDPETAFWRLSRLGRLLPTSPRLSAYNLDHIPADRAMAVDAGTGACLLVRRELWDRVGGLDEGYFMYGEDLELCWQLRQLGYVVWYEPAARVLHLKGQSSRQRVIPMLRQFHRSMWRFYRLHYFSGAGRLLAPAVALGIWGRFACLAGLNLVRRDPRVSP